MSIIYLFSILFFQLLFQPITHADIFGESLAPQGNFIPEETAFEPVLNAYNNFNFEKAIQETKRLRLNRKNREISEKAAFLLGNLYLTMAERERPLYFRKAINAFRNARLRFPDSNQVVPSLMKMGQIYVKEKLYYEALASFNRVIRKHPKSHFGIQARLEKGRVYLGWEKLDKAINEFDQVSPARLPKKERVRLLLNYAEAYYRKENMTVAFQYYKLISPQNTALKSSPKALYQYGVSAYRSKAYHTSREVLFILHNKYPTEPKSLLALARIGDTLRLEGKTDLATKVYEQVYTAGRELPQYKSANLIASIGKLHLEGCTTRPTAQNPICLEGRALKRNAGILAFEKAKESAEHLLHLKRRSDFLDDLIFETAVAFETHGLFIPALTLKIDLIKQKISPLLQNRVKGTINKTAVLAVEQLLKKENKALALGIYYQHQDAFKEKELKGEIGLHLGIALGESGFYQRATELLSPIAFDQKLRKAPIGREALFHLTKIDFNQDNGIKADAHLKRFVTLYPNQSSIPLLKRLSAESSVRQRKFGRAIRKYKAWLSQYPNHPKKRELLIQLGNVYKNEEDPKREISAYLKAISIKGKIIPGIHLKIADAYFRLKNYSKAISFYTKSIDEGGDIEQLDWARFQLAQSYEKSGSKDKSTPLFARLEKNKEDSLIKALSKQKSLNQKIQNEPINP